MEIQTALSVEFGIGGNIFRIGSKKILPGVVE
jgi:hypothetical protein